MNTYSLTDKGLQRSNNQDSYVNYFSSRLALFVVCDGMGGHRAGDTASKLASETIQEFLISAKERTDYEEMVVEAVEAANKAVYDLAKTNPDYFNMGTTCVLVLVHEGRAIIAHVGDSRVYLMRDRSLRQLTEDHSLVQKLINQGLLTEEGARHHPERSTLTRAVGTDERVEVELDYLDLEEGDTVLLCSDGLTTMVEDQEILDLLLTTSEAKDQVTGLVQAALDRGGADNITVTVFEYRRATWTKFY